MRKVYKYFLFFVLFLSFGKVFGADLNQSIISSPETNCNGFQENKTYYIGDTRYFRDMLYGDNSFDWAIGFTSSNVRIYNPYNALTFGGPFVIKSNIKPAGVNSVVVASCDAGVNMGGHAPTRSTLAGQIVFSISRKHNNGYLTGVPASYNYTLPDRSYLQIDYANKPNFNAPVVSDNECLNIYVAWCGDGILDSSYGEQCDPNDASHAGWGAGGCNANCTPNSNPPACVIGNITLPLTSTITASTPGLCPIGQSVGNFNDSTSGTVHNYTWSCDGSTVGGACSASFDTSSQQCARGAGFVNPTETNPILDNTYPAMCPAGQVVGAPTITTSGSVRTAAWSCNSLTGGNCSASWNLTSTINPTCNNLTINGGTTSVTVAAGSSVNFQGTGSNLGSNPTYILTITNATTGANEATLTGTTGAFTHTFNTIGTYNAVLTIRISPTEIIGGTNGCSRSLGVGSNPPSSWYSCSTTNNCQPFTDRISCENASPGKSCYNDSASCLANAPSQCGGGGTSSYYSCSTSSSCQPFSDRVACEAASGGKSCYNSNSTCLANAPTECSGGGGLSTHCGDGVIQLPNSDGQYEQCDSPGTTWCVGCNLTITHPGEKPGRITITNPGEIPGGITTPGSHGYFNLSNYKVIIGSGAPVFGLNDEIRFESSYPLYLSGKTVGINNHYPSIISGASKSYTLGNVGIGRIDVFDHYVYDGSGNIIDAIYTTHNYDNFITIYHGYDLQEFKGNTTGLGTDIYKDTGTYPENINCLYPNDILCPSLYFNVQFHEEALGVRVSKNIVAGISGGNAYIYNPVGFDSNYIAGLFIPAIANGNFVNASTSSSDNIGQNLSSLMPIAKVVGDTAINAKIENKNSTEKTSINTLNTNAITSINTVSEIDNVSDFTSGLAKLDTLGDNDNTLIKKNGDVYIKPGGTPLLLSGVRTIIVENGDLIIERDIGYIDNNASRAFIVKNGNLYINNIVGKISGAYLVLNSSRTISSPNPETTEKQLIVEGNLIGNSNDLSSKRTYVRGTLNSTTLTSGIIVNYSNRVLKNPPPMLTYFINQYNQKKIAK